MSQAKQKRSAISVLDRDRQVEMRPAMIAGRFERSRVRAGNQPLDAQRAQCCGDSRRLTPAVVRQMRIADARITSSDGKNSIEFGLPMADQNHSKIFLNAEERVAAEALEHWPAEAGKLKPELPAGVENELAVVASAPHVVGEVAVGADARNFRYGSRAREEMGEFQQYFDIILFAMVAVFLVLRLRSVLGRRTGNERRRDLFVRRPRPAPETAPDKVPALGRTGHGAAANPGDRLPRLPIRSPHGVNRIRRADPSFDPTQFLDGARVAFEMIVTAFAAGDKAALQPLLSARRLSAICHCDRRARRRQGDPRDARPAARSSGHRRSRARGPHRAGDGEAGLAADQRHAGDGRKHRRRRSGTSDREDRLLDFRARYAIRRSELGSHRHQQRLRPLVVGETRPSPSPEQALSRAPQSL